MAKQNKTQVYAPGMRVEARGEEWLVRRVDKSTSGQAVRVVGVSSLVRGQERVFLTDLDKNIKVVDPRETKFVLDRTPRFRNSRLFIESQLRRTCPTDNRIYVGHKAAIDPLKFQFTPALKALKAPRARILIADTVGLGKTIECGVLLSELIKRGRGKRILVLTVKSMLAQFQKELWSRFSIPLVRLDSVGIQRVRNRIPANANPFNYYDKAIVSIDTLKRAGEYRNYLENCRWDVIAIDEAHNVAERNGSQRAKLAKLVASRCDSLVMLSATPHDGRRESFASLVDMLDPTAIADPGAYTAKDVESLVVRRFKKDVREEIRERGSFKERLVETMTAKATSEEETAFDLLTNLKFKRIDAKRKPSAARSGNYEPLFTTVLEKALFSSPAACRETIERRVRKLDAETGSDARDDAEALRELDAALAKVTPEKFSRYQALLAALKPTGPRSIGWSAEDAKDRLVIFAERVATVDFLAERLQKDLDLPQGSVVKLDASLGDVAVMETVSQFGAASSPIRILVCTDVASEGINLHYCSHRLVHFDTPWSLITFQQRNGRIDRYGQLETPEIRYISVEAVNEKINGDRRILELLQKKDKEVVDSIGDPSEFSGCSTSKEEEDAVSQAMEAQANPFDFFDELTNSANSANEVSELIHTDETSSVEQIEYGEEPSLYERDYDYLIDALDFVNSAARKRLTLADDPLDYEVEDDGKKGSGACVRIAPNRSLEARMKYLPPEILPDEREFILCDSPKRVQREYDKFLKLDGEWPKIQYLWNEHPLLEYLNESVLAAFGRMRAPLMLVGDKLAPNETLFILSALVPNNQSQPVVSARRGLLWRDGKLVESKPLEFWIEKLKLDETLQNPHAESNPDAQTFEELDLEACKEFEKPLAEVVDAMIAEIRKDAEAKQAELDAAKRSYLAKLDDWRRGKLDYIAELFNRDEFAPKEKTQKSQEESRRKLEIERVYEDYERWCKSAATISAEHPSITVVAALKGGR